MTRSLSRRRILQIAAAAAMSATPGCGTIMYPERRGQLGGPIDWRVVGLDALLLLFFFIPGVVAFAVDFTTGAIYLPCCYMGDACMHEERRLTTIHVPRSQLTTEGIARAVSEHTQREVELAAGQYQTQELDDVDQFWPTYDTLAAG